VSQNKNNVSALSLKRQLGVCYRTAWRIEHKLLEAMAERERARPLVAMVVADDASLGGVHAGKRSRRSENKALFIAAVDLSDDGFPRHVRFDPLPDLKGSTVFQWASAVLDPSVHLVTDGLASLGAAAAVVAHDAAIVVSPRKSGSSRRSAG
jgi:hypothetical protein